MPLTESIFTKVLDYIWAANLSFDTELQVVNCRTTILQQGDSNTDFAWNFQNFQRKAILHSTSNGKVFFTKIEEHNYVFRTSNFSE